MYSDNQCYKNLQLWKLKAELTAFVNTIQAEITVTALVIVTTDNIQSYVVNHYTQNLQLLGQSLQTELQQKL